MFYERLEPPSGTDPSRETAGPLLEIEGMADRYVIFLCEAGNDNRALSSGDAQNIEEVCNAFNSWLAELDKNGFKVEISLNSAARNHLATQARVMNVRKVEDWLVDGVGKILRTNSPLRIKEKATGMIRHEAVYEEVVIAHRVLPSVQRPQQ